MNNNPNIQPGQNMQNNQQPNNVQNAQPNQNVEYEIVDPEKVGGMGGVVAFLLIAVLGLVGYILYDKGIIFNDEKPAENSAAVNENNNNETNPNNNVNPNENNTPNNNTVLDNNIEKEMFVSDIEKNDLNTYIYNLNIILGTDNYVYDKEYMGDNNFAYAFVWYDAMSHLRWNDEIVSEDGIVTSATGGVSFKYDDFVYFYKKVIGYNFNINNLSKDSNLLYSVSYPNIKEVKTFNSDGVNKIFGSRIIGFMDSMMHLEFSKLTYNESNKTYTVEINYFNYTNFDAKMKDNIGMAKLKYQMDDLGNKTFTSFVITK